MAKMTWTEAVLWPSDSGRSFHGLVIRAEAFFQEANHFLCLIT